MSIAFAATIPFLFRRRRARPEARATGPQALRDACRALARRRAVLSAASSFLPVPGIDFITDVAVLSRLIADINDRFGVTSAEVARLREGWRGVDRVLAYRLATAGTGFLAARAVTPALVMSVLRLAGVRLTAMEATRLVPVVGQAVAAGIAYVALTRIADRHIEDCLVIVASRGDATGT